jgi:hypothetical protein
LVLIPYSLLWHLFIFNGKIEISLRIEFQRQKLYVLVLWKIQGIWWWKKGVDFFTPKEKIKALQFHAKRVNLLTLLFFSIYTIRLKISHVYISEYPTCNEPYLFVFVFFFLFSYLVIYLFIYLTFENWAKLFPRHQLQTHMNRRKTRKV